MIIVLLALIFIALLPIAAFSISMMLRLKGIDLRLMEMDILALWKKRREDSEKYAAV